VNGEESPEEGVRMRVFFDKESVVWFADCAHDFLTRAGENYERGEWREAEVATQVANGYLRLAELVQEVRP
jgi:hypothetical protein